MRWLALTAVLLTGCVTPRQVVVTVPLVIESYVGGDGWEIMAPPPIDYTQTHEEAEVAVIWED